MCPCTAGLACISSPDPKDELPQRLSCHPGLVKFLNDGRRTESLTNTEDRLQGLLDISSKFTSEWLPAVGLLLH